MEHAWQRIHIYAVCIMHEEAKYYNGDDDEMRPVAILDSCLWNTLNEDESAKEFSKKRRQDKHYGQYWFKCKKYMLTWSIFCLPPSYQKQEKGYWSCCGHNKKATKSATKRIKRRLRIFFSWFSSSSRLIPW